MQTIKEISTTEYFNEATKLYEKKNIAVKYIGLALVKVSIVIDTKIYSADTPEDSNLKKGAKYIARTVFNAAKAIDKASYLGSSSIALSTGIITNYFGTENTASNKYANSLIYFGGISLATIISCSFLNALNIVRTDVIPKLNRIIASRNFCIAVSNYFDRARQLHGLYSRTDSITNEMITITSEINSEMNNLSMQLDELIILIANLQNETDNHPIMVLLYRMNPVDTTARENEIIAYDELELYTGDYIDNKTLTVISKVKLQDAEQPVFCENQVYEYKHLVTWHKMPYPNIDGTCPHNRNKLIWSNVQKIRNQELIAIS